MHGTAGRRLVVVADHAKWAMVGISTVVAPSEADLVVTDDQLSTEARAAPRDCDVRAVLARTGTAWRDTWPSTHGTAFPAHDDQVGTA